MPARSVLDGTLVIDLSEIFQAPLAAQVLGDFGARVIKVERPGTGDMMRNMDSHARENGLLSSYFAAGNRNKESICLDLKNPAGRDVLLGLIERADVVVTNYRPGVLERLGLGHDVLQALNPRLIFAVATGYGETGPYASRPAQDMIAQTISGMSRSGQTTDEPLVITATPTVDFASGMILAQGILLALLERHNSGRGQKVSTCLLDTAIAIQSAEAAAQLMYGLETNWRRRGLSLVLPTSDGWMTILGFFRPNPLRLFCAALGIEDLSATPEFDTLDKQIAGADRIRELIAPGVSRLTTAECTARFEAQDVICAPALTLAEALEHPQVLHNEMIVEAEIPSQATARMIGSPLKMSRTPPQVRRGPPLLGADATKVLADFGYNEAARARLLASGAHGPARGTQV